MALSSNTVGRSASAATDSWIPTILGILLLLAALVIWYTFVNINKIRAALATEVLEQQHDVEELTSGYTNVLLAVQREQLAPDASNRARLLEELDATLVQLDRMRSNYSFERLDGAAKAHAYVKPIIEDIDQWLAKGLYGQSERSAIVLELVKNRLQERLNALRDISTETHTVANVLIDDQEHDLTQFRNWLLVLLLAFLLLSACFIYVLLKQRKLQLQLVQNQRDNAYRFREFASIGADWFWETDATANLITDTNFLEFDNVEGASVNSESEVTNATERESLSQTLLPLERMSEQNPFSNHECSVVLPDGNTRDFSISARPQFYTTGSFAGYRGVGRDITRRKKIERELEQATTLLVQAEMRGRAKAEEAMQASEQFLRKTIDSLPQRIIILDSDGRIVETNQSLEDFSRNFETPTNSSWIGKDFSKFLQTSPTITPADNSSITSAEELVKMIREIATDGKEPIRMELSTGEGNEQRWYVFSAQQLTTRESNYALLFYDDVTTSRRLQEQDRRLRADLAHASRLTTAGEMASGLAHELNQPLTAISHNCDAITLLLNDETLEPENIESVFSEAVGDIATQTQRAGDIILSMRQMVRKDSSDFRAVDLQSLVEETLRLTRPAAKEKRVQVTLDLAKNLPQVLINPVQIQQVLVNLERNGIEATEQSLTDLKNLKVATQRYDEDFAIVSVIDSGPGFDTTIAENLFTSFLTTKEDGMGLGLSISRSIVEAHGGRIWLESESRETCISFTLPFADNALVH